MRDMLFCRYDTEALDEALSNPTDQRIFAIADAIYNHNYSAKQLHDLTKIDYWFLNHLMLIKELSDEIKSRPFTRITREAFLLYKRAGFSDLQIAMRVGATEMQVLPSLILPPAHP
jgi:carbamoyl-phosphate synthase large subunit